MTLESHCKSYSIFHFGIIYVLKKFSWKCWNIKLTLYSFDNFQKNSRNCKVSILFCYITVDNWQVQYVNVTSCKPNLEASWILFRWNDRDARRNSDRERGSHAREFQSKFSTNDYTLNALSIYLNKSQHSKHW